MNCLGKRFIFATIAIICISFVTVKLGYNGEIYLKLIGAIVGLFLTSQTITDVKKNGKEIVK